MTSLPTPPMPDVGASPGTGRPASARTGLGGGRRVRRWRSVVEYAGLIVVWIGASLLLGGGVVRLLLLGIPLIVGFQLVARRRPLRQLWARDTTTFGQGRIGKVTIAAILLAVVAVMVLQTIPAWTDDGWTVLLMVGVLLAGYAILRRILLTLAAAALAVAVAMAILAPSLAPGRSGDAQLLSQLSDQQSTGMLAGYQDLAVARVDLGAAQPVRLASIGSITATTPMEVGSLTKALTGLVIADEVKRGELRLDAPVATYLPQLRGSAAGEVTMQELVTHRAGYAEFGAATLRRGFWSAPVGINFMTTDLDQLIGEIKDGGLDTRGSYSYSSLGAAAAGQAAANAAGMSFADLMHNRLFEPLGMSHTSVQSSRALVSGGISASGLPIQPWIVGAYAPAGAVVSTTQDLATLATALLEGTAPGLDALSPTVTAGASNTRIGDFWQISRWQNGQTITWHNGQTSGYTSYLGLDRAHRKAIIVLSDVSNPVDDLGAALLANQR